MATYGSTGNLSFFNHFFGGHRAGFRLVNSMYDGSNYTERTQNPCPARSLMDVANYKPCDKSSSNNMMPGDVHYRFTDIIIATAKFHRSIDMPQQKDKRLNVIGSRDNIVNKVREVVLSGPFDLFARLGLNNDDSIRSAIVGAVVPLDDRKDVAVNRALERAINVSKMEQERLRKIAGDDLNSADRVALNKLFLDTFSETLFRSLKDLTQSVEHTYVESTGAAEQLVRTVYGNWSNLNADERKFYYDNIGLFRKTDSTSSLYGLPEVASNQRNAANTLWQRLSCDELDSGILNKYAGSGNIFSRLNLRLNLMKSLNDNVLFAENLPVVKVGTRIWFTDANGILGSTDRHSLLDIYNDVYHNNGLLSVPSNPPSLDDIDVCLDMPKYMADLIKGCSQDSVQQPERVIANVEGTLDDYEFLNTVTDTVYGYNWKYDGNKKQFFRIEGNSRVYYDEFTKNASNTCYSTYLGGNRGSNKEGCKRISDCILTADGDSLGRCMDVIKDSSLWNVAFNDIKSVDPEKIRKILRKFNVRANVVTAENGEEIKQPQSYNEWFNSLPSDKKKLYNTNKPMLSYLRGLIEICRGNPVVLNAGVKRTNIIGVETTPQLLKNLGLKRGLKYNPSSKKTNFSMLAGVLKQVNRSDIAPVILTPNINRGLINPYSMSGGAGGFYSVGTPELRTLNTRSTIENYLELDKDGITSNVYRQLFRNIRNALRDVGAKMSSDDERKLEQTIGLMNKHEIEIAKMAKMLYTFVKIARVTGVPPIYRFNTQNLRPISLRELDNSNLNEFIGHHISNLNSQLSNSNNTMNINHNNLMSTLVKFVNELNVLYGGVPLDVTRTPKPRDNLVDID